MPLPPSPPKNVNDELQAFLAWNKAQVNEGYTIANLFLRQEQLATELRVMVQGQNTQLHNLNARVSDGEVEREQIHARLDHHGAAIIAIKRRVRNGNDDEEMDTGQFDLAAIQRRVAEQERKRADSERAQADNQVWWKRSIIMWVVGGFGVVATALFTVLVTLAIANSRPAPPPEHPSALPTAARP